MSSIVKGWHWLFGKELTPKQIIRRNQRLIKKAIQNIEREQYTLEREEQKQIVQIKRTAQKNQPDLTRSMANDLVRLRGQVKKLLKMKQQLQGVSMHLLTLESQQSVSEAVYQATMVLRGMNQRLNMPKIQAILKEFEKQAQVMEIKGEMIGETMDDVAGHEDDGEESEEIISQVLEELGIQISQQLPEAPFANKDASKHGMKNGVAQAVGMAGSEGNAGSSAMDDELMERLERLRKT